MRVHLYQIFDLQACTIMGQIITTAREGAAIRGFRDIIRNEQAPPEIKEHPEDFVLMHLGWQDTESGEIEGITPTPIYSGTDYLKELAASQAKQPPAPANGADASGRLIVTDQEGAAPLTEDENQFLTKRLLELRNQRAAIFQLHQEGKMSDEEANFRLSKLNT